MKHETLAAWLQWLEQQHAKEIDLGLSRVAEVAVRLQLLPQLNNHSKIITVAGSNGKGSFIRSLEALLLNKNKSVAVYTSPHLLVFNERIQINGQMISDDDLMQAFQCVYEALASVSLSYFEFTTLAALWLFSKADVEYCLLEIGLGGRLDAVNIIEPDWAVITSIALDHCDYLGHDLNSIAKEKCGILRENTPLICAEIDKPDALQRACDSHSSHILGKDFFVDLDSQGSSQWQYEDNDFKSEILQDNGLSLSSQAAAIKLYRILMEDRFNPADLECLSSVYLAGRFQQFTIDDTQIILDVAHNSQAVSLLKRRLNEQMPLALGRKRLAVFAMLDDKDADSVIALLKNDIKAWFLADVDHPRAVPAKIMADKVHDQGIHMISVSKNIRQAFARAQMLAEEGDQIVVLGSFFTVSAVLSRLQRH